jgi:hypothetical protein
MDVEATLSRIAIIPDKSHLFAIKPHVQYIAVQFLIFTTHNIHVYLPVMFMLIVSTINHLHM